MTIAAGFRIDDGILICAESQYTGAAKIFQQKIFPMTITGDSYVFALAGHELNGKMAIDECQEAISELALEQRSLRNVTRALKKAVKPICDDYVLSRPAGEQDQFAFELLVGCSIPRGGGNKLFTIGRNGAVVRQDHYDCIGSGSYLGHYFIRPFFSQILNMDALKLLAAQALRAAKSYDPSCGGPSTFVIIGPDGKHYLAPYNHPFVDTFLSMYEGNTRRLMFSAAQDSEAEYNDYLAWFTEQLTQLRAGWQSMMRPFITDRPNPQSTTTDPSPQPPLPESQGGTGES